MAEQVLHVLSPVEDGPIEAKCGHRCTASPHTVAWLEDKTVKHVVVCIDCLDLLMEDT